jgi:hypothetical protein
MLCNPLNAHRAEIVSGRLGEDDNPQRDKTSDQRHRCSYPEHRILIGSPRTHTLAFSKHDAARDGFFLLRGQTIEHCGHSSIHLTSS